MKKTDVSRFSAWILAAVIGLSFAACEDEKTPEEVVAVPTAPLTVSSVIADPKVGMPGDTLLFTAVVTSDEANEGDYPVMAWTATGGTLIDDDKLTVRWLAPNASGVFTLTARATNSVNSATGSTSVFVGAGSQLLYEYAGQIDLIGGGPDFRYFYTKDVTRGVDVHQYVGGAESDPIPPPLVPPLPGLQLNTVYSSDGTMCAWAADTVAFGVTVRPRHVNVGNFAGGSYVRLTVDGARPGFAERNRYEYPSFSPDGQVLAYQRWAQSWDGVSTDSFHVYIHDLIAGKRTLVTYEQAFPRGFFPTFSTDENWLVYVLDRDRTGQWELYGSPMSGHDVEGSLASLKKFTATGGQIVTGAPKDLKKPPMAWNPVSSVLAVAAADNTLYLVETNPTGANMITVSEVTRAQEIVWSADGSMLAATFAFTNSDGDTQVRIVTVTPAGVVTVRNDAPVGDTVRDLAFSPDGNWMLYRVTRGGGCWFNVLDIGAGLLTAPVPITATDPVGAASNYRAVMSLRPAWTSANLVIYPSFNDNASSTPGVYTRDLSGLVD